MHRAAILLASLCSVSARFGPAFGPMQYHKNVGYPPPRGPFVATSLYGSPRPPAPIIEDTYENNSLDGLLLNFPTPQQESAGKQSWVPQPYYKSLKDFDEGLARLTKNFNVRAVDIMDDDKIRYIVIVNAIQGLAKDVSRFGWGGYDNNYKGLIKKFIDEAAYDPRAVVDYVNCASLQPARNAIWQIRRVIESPAVKHVCSNQPSTCDSVIWAILNTNASPSLQYSADVLLASAKAASTFVKYYAHIFELVSKQNVFSFLLESKEQLRGLVAADALALNVINSQGEANCVRSSNQAQRPPAPYISNNLPFDKF